MDDATLDRAWTAIDDQRRRTADLLERLTPEQWEQPSLCDGWTVGHVAAHLTLQRQSLGDLAGFIGRNPEMLRAVTLNRVIHDSAVIRARLPRDEVVGLIRAGIGSRRHNSFVTPLETLTDALVHGQDVAVPLGLGLEADPDAAALAATRRWDTRRSWMSRVFRRVPLDAVTLRATDVDWQRGNGPEVRGPVLALLLLLTGRPAALDRLAGPGVDTLRDRLTSAAASGR